MTDERGAYLERLLAGEASGAALDDKGDPLRLDDGSPSLEVVITHSRY